MKVLLLNQTFHPDVASTAQHLKDLALGLTGAGHEVTVIAGRRAYDDPSRRFPASENWRGIRIRRVFSTGFGKRAWWRRAADFASFNLACIAELLRLPAQDAVIALTSPPLISFIGAWFAKLRGGRFYYWVMDLNPDEAVAAGWLRESSPLARLLEGMSRVSLRQAEKIIVLDRFMEARLEAKGVPRERIEIIAPWSHDDEVGFDAAGRRAFRARHGLSDKFVVMYSGNHSPCHPLDTLLEAALRMAGDEAVAFCFVGGGSEFRKVQRFAGENRLRNILCLAYQPLAELAGSLSAADLHVVVMGNPFVGTIHPCKIYNILNVEAPILYIGPAKSHVSDVLDRIARPGLCQHAAHGDADAVVACIRDLAAKEPPQRAGGAYRDTARGFAQGGLVPRFVAVVR